MKSQFRAERVHTIVIGAGQAGLAAGYFLAKRGKSFLILDANQRVGDAWRNRWDSLRLFSPARYVQMPGFAYPGPGDAFPTKDQIADHLETYAKHFRLPVLGGTKVDRLSKDDGRFLIEAGGQLFEADNVVVAMANYQVPNTPAFAPALSAGIVQVHSHKYKNPSQLRDGGVLVVGVGNSGADIAIDVAKRHPTWIAGKESGHIPWPIDTFVARHFLIRLIRFLGHHVLTTSTPMGRKARPKMLTQASPLVRVKPQDLVDAGIKRVGKVVGVRNGQPLLAEGGTLDVQNVIWCTGYQPGFTWIDLPAFGEDGRPAHERGVVAKVPGLYFVGLHFLHSMTSATVTGVGRDAEHVVKAIYSRQAPGLSRDWTLRPAEAG